MLLVTVVVLVALAALGLWVVRLGLRPLTAIEGTAGAIAAGDLSQRVERAEPDTEVGRLGHRAQHDARPHRGVVPRPGGIGAEAAAVRRRRVARAPDAARRRARLLGALHPRRRSSARRPRALDDRHHARVRAHEPARRGPAPARAPGRGPAARARARPSSTRSSRRQSRRPGRSSPRRPIETEIAPAVVLGDRDRLRQIVDNLLSNVRAHTPPETPVHVRVWRARTAPP